MYHINKIIKYSFYLIYFYLLLVLSTILVKDIVNIRAHGYLDSLSSSTIYIYLFIIITSVLIINKSTNKSRMTSFILFLVSLSDLSNSDIKDVPLNYFFFIIMLIAIILFIYSFYNVKDSIKS